MVRKRPAGSNCNYRAANLLLQIRVYRDSAAALLIVNAYNDRRALLGHGKQGVASCWAAEYHPTWRQDYYLELGDYQRRSQTFWARPCCGHIAGKILLGWRGMFDAVCAQAFQRNLCWRPDTSPWESTTADVEQGSNDEMESPTEESAAPTMVSCGCQEED